MRNLPLTVLALAAMLAPALPAANSSPPKLSAEQLVAKNVAARGGLEAWRKVQTMLWLGHIESARATSPSLQFMLAQQRPDKTHFEINAMGDKTLRVFDGARGWKLRPAHGGPAVEPFTLQEVRFEKDGPGLDGVLIDYAAKGSSVELTGIDKIEKRKAYHLIVHRDSGDTQHVWLDAKTFLELRYDRTASGADGASKTVSIVYRDYMTTEGLKIPSIIETGVGPGAAPDRLVIEKVVLNPPLDARTFAEPGARTKARQAAVPANRHRATAPGGGLPAWLSNPAPPRGADSPAGSPPAGDATPPNPAQDPGSTPR